MESYHKKKRLLEEKYGKLIIVKPPNYIVDKNPIVSHRQQQIVKQLRDITDEEGLKRAYDTKDGLYQHYNKLFIAGTRDFPGDHIDDLKLPLDDTLNKTKRGRDADAYYRSHHEIDTIVGHSLGGAVALSLEKQYKKEGNDPYGIIQSKTFGSPAVSANFSGTNPNRIRYFGDPISALDFNATTVIPSIGFRFNNSAHSYKGLFIKDAVPLHDVEKNPLTTSPDDSKATVITS
uniref:lipase family protein n=1 Tax=Flavobacterium sp. TaxID=239 RepID=UPI0040496D7C